MNRTQEISGTGKGQVKAISVTGSAGQIGTAGASYVYDQFGLLSQIKLTGADWDVREEHDAQLRPSAQLDPDGRRTVIGWDVAGRWSSLEPPNGQVATMLHYIDHREVQAQRGAQEQRYRFNGFGELIREARKGPLGWNHRLFGYDPAGRRTWESGWRSGLGENNLWSSPLGPEDVFIPGTLDQYVDGDCSETTTETDANGVTTIKCIAWEKILVPGTSPKTLYVNSTHHVYDAYGREILMIDPNQSAVRIDYSAANGRIMRQVTKGLIWNGASIEESSLMATTTLTQDITGRLVSVTPPDLAPGASSIPTQYEYDEENRIARVTQWDNLGRPQVRTWSYDQSTGYLTALSQPESGLTSYGEFTIHGKPRFTNYAGRLVYSKYHPNLDRLERIWSEDGSVDQTYKYDGPGKQGRLSQTNNSRVTRELDYDTLTGHLKTVTQTIDGWAFSLGLGYDGYGTVTSRTYPDGRVQSLTPEEMIGLIKTSYFSGAFIASLDYEDTTWNVKQITWSNGPTCGFTYDKDQTRLASMSHGIPGSPNSSKIWNYAYNPAGQLGTDGEDWYAYDKWGRLVRAFVRDPFDTYQGKGNLGIRQMITYDAFGNRTSLDSKTLLNWPAGTVPMDDSSTNPIPTSKAQTYTFSAGGVAFTKNQLPAAATILDTGASVSTGASYDAQGNLTQIYKIIGDTTKPVTLTYDSLGRVKAMMDTSQNVVEIYSYDDQGLRVIVEVYQGFVAPQNLQKKQYRIYNEARQLISEYESVLE